MHCEPLPTQIDLDATVPWSKQMVGNKGRGVWIAAQRLRGWRGKHRRVHHDGRVWYPTNATLRAAEDDANKVIHECRPEHAQKLRDQAIRDAMEEAAKVSFALDDAAYMPQSEETFEAFEKRVKTGSVLRAIPHGKELNPALRFSCSCPGYSKYAQCECSVAATIDAKLAKIPAKHDVTIMGGRRTRGRPAKATPNHYAH